MPLRLSVAMPTFNGERFIRQQLATIVTQSRQPDELVISDDGSADTTLEIVRGVAVSAGTTLRILESDHRGLRRNVERAMAACTGDVIVLADQDDIWRPGKLDAVARAFDDERVALWFSDADVVDDRESPFGYGLWDAVRLTPRDQAIIRDGNGLRRLLHGSTVTGATMAFRRDLLEVALPLPHELEHGGHLFLHDGWIAVLAAMLGKTVVDSTAYVAYRQHGAQVTNMRVTELSDRLEGRARRVAPVSQHALADEHARVRLVLDRLQARGALDRCRPDDARTLVELDALLAVRAGSRGLARTRAILRELRAGRYRTYARGWRTALADLLYPRH